MTDIPEPVMAVLARQTREALSEVEFDIAAMVALLDDGDAEGAEAYASSLAARMQREENRAAEVLGARLPAVLLALARFTLGIERAQAASDA
jgi:hypothetical protein